MLGKIRNLFLNDSDKPTEHQREQMPRLIDLENDVGIDKFKNFYWWLNWTTWLWPCLGLLLVDIDSGYKKYSISHINSNTKDVAVRVSKLAMEWNYIAVVCGGSVHHDPEIEVTDAKAYSDHITAERNSLMSILDESGLWWRVLEHRNNEQEYCWQNLFYDSAEKTVYISTMGANKNINKIHLNRI
jgi:hypothetical protein